MSDLKRISVVAIVLLVLLRIAIGWQFLYEGLWKYDKQSSANPWSPKGYLVNAEGPFRDYFRGMVSDFPQENDPDDLLWLDYDVVSAAWDRWAHRFAAHYGLTDEQKSRLDELIEGPKVIRSGNGLPKLPKLPEGVPADFKGLQPDLKFEDGVLVISNGDVLTPDDVDTALSWIGGVMSERIENGEVLPTLAERDDFGNAKIDENGQPVRIDDGLKKLYAGHLLNLQSLVQQRLGARQKLRATLMGDPSRAGVYLQAKGTRLGGKMGEPDPDADYTHLIHYGEIRKYKDELRAYETARKRATMPYEFDHLARLKTKLEDLKRKAVGPVRTIDSDLKEAAKAMLTVEQIARGPLAPEDTPTLRAGRQAMWGLIILGCLLIVGLATRVAAIAGAVMLMMFYLVAPPWPGVPEIPGPEHSFIVNKNLIEAIALVSLAALPSGSWFGLDGVIRWIFTRKQASQSSTDA